MTENEELSRKLAEWAGFKERFGGEWRFEQFKATNHWWVAPNGRKFRELPNFTESLDACFKWLVPKIFEQGLFVSLVLDKRFNRATILSGLLDREDAITAVGEADTPALALCKAIEKLIDMEVT